MNTVPLPPPLSNVSETSAEKYWVMLVGCILFALGLGMGVAMHSPHSINLALSDIRLDGKELPPDTISDLLKKLGRHMILPDDDLPQIASVIDAATLSAQQPFYAQVNNGDIVLLYAKTQRAIIYSPSRDVVVNAGPIVLDPNAPTDLNQ